MEKPHNPLDQTLFLNAESWAMVLVGSGPHSLQLIRENFRSSSPRAIELYDLEFSKELVELSDKHPELSLFNKTIESQDLKDRTLVILSPKAHFLEEELLEWIQNRKILIHVMGKPSSSDFSFADLLQTDQLFMGIKLGEFAPEVQHRIRRIVKESLPQDIDPFIERLKFAHKHPLMNISDELQHLDKLTQDYLNQKKKSTLRDSEFDNLSKVVKAVRRRANIYLGIIGFIVLLGLFSYILVEFKLFPDIGNFLSQDNHIFYKMLLVGFIAEIVAGSMGMGYGVLCTTILLMLNVAPPVVSASIHSAETFTSAAGSISHFKLKNVNKKLVKALALPAILGAIIGALALSFFGEQYAHIVKPIISVYTLYLGINILRNAFKRKKEHKRKAKTDTNLGFLGLVGGFIDSFAGGGWGPLVTGTLMKDGRTPRYVVGSSTVSKFILTLTSAITFFITIGIQHWNIVLGLLLGGIITAPFSAMLTAKLPVKKMFVVIGILVIVMSTISIVRAFL
ncbi:TSUP family transporter [Chryseobacterium sp. A301]